MTSTAYDTNKRHARDRVNAWAAENRLPAPESVYIWPECITVHVETLADLRAYAAVIGQKIHATAVVEDDEDKLSAWAFVGERVGQLFELPGVPLPACIAWWPR